MELGKNHANTLPNREQKKRVRKDHQESHKHAYLLVSVKKWSEWINNHANTLPIRKQKNCSGRVIKNDTNTLTIRSGRIVGKHVGWLIDSITQLVRFQQLDVFWKRLEPLLRPNTVTLKPVQ